MNVKLFLFFFKERNRVSIKIFTSKIIDGHKDYSKTTNINREKIFEVLYNFILDDYKDDELVILVEGKSCPFMELYANKNIKGEITEFLLKVNSILWKDIHYNSIVVSFHANDIEDELNRIEYRLNRIYSFNKALIKAMREEYDIFEEILYGLYNLILRLI